MQRIYLDVIYKSKTEILFFSSIKKFMKQYRICLNLGWQFQRAKRETFNHSEFINPDPTDIEYGLKRKTGFAQVRSYQKNSNNFCGNRQRDFEDKLVVVSLNKTIYHHHPKPSYC